VCLMIPAPSLYLLFWEYLILHISFLQKNMHWCSGKLIMDSFSFGRTFIAFIVSHAHIQLLILCVMVWCAVEPKTFHNTVILGLLYSYGYCYPVCDSIQFLELLREIDAQFPFKIYILNSRL
jgi:hypothetical protein